VLIKFIIIFEVLDNQIVKIVKKLNKILKKLKKKRERIKKDSIPLELKYDLLQEVQTL
jgi:hypothetical protein